MAADVKAPGTKEGAATLVAAVFLFNWASAEYLNYPFVWCWGRHLGPVFEPWLFPIHFIALAYFVLAVVSQNIIKIAGAMLVVIIAFGLPMYLEILFRLGKNCS